MLKPTVTTADDLLLLLRQFQYLSIRQITRLLGKETSINNMRSKLKKLVESGLVEITSLPHTEAGGKMPFIYSLTKKGQLRLSLADSGTRSKKSGLALEHTLAINDVAILAQVLPKSEPRITLSELRQESSLKKYPIPINENKSIFLVPDLFVHFTLSPPYGKYQEPLGIIFEIDRNTEDMYQMKEKIRNYVAFSSGIYQEYFQLESLTICFMIMSGGSSRVKQLCTWTEQELKKQKTLDLSDLFLFGACDPALSSPRSFFCDYFWSQPFTAAPQPLIEKRADLSSTMAPQKK